MALFSSSTFLKRIYFEYTTTERLSRTELFPTTNKTTFFNPATTDVETTTSDITTVVESTTVMETTTDVETTEEPTTEASTTEAGTSLMTVS